MHIQLDMLDIVFRIVIFLLLGYKLHELAHRYVIPFLFKHIETEKNHQLELLEKEKLFISTENRIENQISAQKKMFILLEKNMQLTHSFLIARNEQAEKDARHTLQNLQEKRALQKKQFILMKTSQEVIPETITIARQELEERYATHDGVVTLKKIIASLNPQK